MEHKIEIGKRTGESLACWRVNADAVAPNTVLAPADGILLVVKVGGVSKIKSGTPVTVFGLFNPGKEKKLLGGNKPYGDCEIYAIDQSSSFSAEWGLGGPTAMPCRDPDLNAECKAVAFGEYGYKIENFVAFINSVPFRGDVISRDDIREYLRGETTPVIRSVLAGPVMQKGVEACAANLGALSSRALDEINARLNPKGIRVESFSISRIDYDGEHRAMRERLNDTRIRNAIRKEENAGKRDDIGVEAMEVNEVKVPLIDAMNGNSPREKRETVVCPRCSERNDGSANYCRKCGAKLGE